MKNNKGFTLIELLIVIAVMAVLGLAFGLNSVKVQEEANKKENKEYLSEIFNATTLYAGLSSSNCPSGCSTTLGTVVKSGYLSSDIYNKKNCLNKNFDPKDVLNIEIVNGETQVSYVGCNYNSININD